jgi:hypothetical protein
MDTKKLRQKILDLAIHGKLVPQDPNDEPASVLLERIRAEKERLIKEGKIKRSRKTTKTSDDACDKQEVPFEVPSGWVWTIINEVGNIVTGGTPQKDIKEYYGGSIPFYKPNDLEQGINTLTAADHLSILGFEQSRKLPINSVLVTCIGATIGKTGRILKEGTCNQQINAVIHNQSINPLYLYYILVSEYFQHLIRSNASATTLPILNKSNFSKLRIPLPPLAEQQRIAAEIKRWFNLIDIIEQGKADLQITIKQAKNKILELAIHGKLVPQDPNDEPASELLKRINPKAEITCDNGHYKQLPYNWHWLKGKYIFSPMKSIKPSGEDFLYIDIESIDNKKQIINEVKNIKTANAPSRASRYTKKGDVVFSMVRPYLRNIAKIERDNCIASTGFFVCSPVKEILLSTYCYYLMISSYVVDGLNHFMKGDNSPSINKKDIDEWLFPIPPIAEQLRIVDKIEKLLLPLSEIQKTLEM